MRVWVCCVSEPPGERRRRSGRCGLAENPDFPSVARTRFTPNPDSPDGKWPVPLKRSDPRRPKWKQVKREAKLRNENLIKKLLPLPPDILKDPDMTGASFPTSDQLKKLVAFHSSVDGRSVYVRRIYHILGSHIQDLGGLDN